MAKAQETPITDPVTDAIVGALKAVTGDSLKGLAPTRAVEGVSFYGTIAAYRALAAAAKKVCCLVEKHGAKKVLICGSLDLPDLVAYRAFFKAADILLEEIKADLNMPEEPPGGDALKLFAPALIAPAISAGLALASFLFHRELKEVNSSITLDSRALVTLVGQELREALVMVAEPASLAFAMTDSDTTPAKGRLRARLEQLEKKGAALRERLGSISERLEPKTGDNPHPRLAGLKARFEGTLKALAALEEATAKNLPQLVRGDEMATFLAGDAAHILSVQILAAGGGTRTEASTLSRDRIEHSGGVVVGATLLHSDSTIVVSEIIVEHQRTQEDHHLGDWKDTGL